MGTPQAPIETRRIESVSQYALLGRSGLRVSPLCLGTMTFGEASSWGCSEDTARSLFDRYIEAGGNFFDTADRYTNGQSETLLGKFMRDAGNRDRLVVATKFTFNGNPGDPNAGGNSRKHMREAVEQSLRRLQTDYIDLYWLHAWDGITPVEEVMSTLDALVGQGKVRYIGFSDVPAWYLARGQTLAQVRGWTPLSALQLEYSLVERNIEFEYVDAAHELGLGICPWSPLASGLLTGKYARTGDGGASSENGRLDKMKGSENPVFQKFSDRNWTIVEALVEVAEKIDRSPAQVALNWVTKRPGVASTIIGATKQSQLDDNLAALDFEIPDELRQRLDGVSEPERHFPYIFFHGHIPKMMTGGTSVRAEQPWYR